MVLGAAEHPDVVALAPLMPAGSWLRAHRPFLLMGSFAAALVLARKAANREGTGGQQQREEGATVVVRRAH